ncbi:MAG TPA: RagB/SusD family nutrient uptake outer membrane protein [Sphingobacteriaceae bacterium]
MKFKYINRTLLGLALCVFVASCDDALEIEPKQNISATTALSSTEDVQNALIGAYSALGRPSLYGTNMILVSDLLANTGYLDWTGTFNSYRDLGQKITTATNAEATRTWTNAYAGINIANTVIGALDKVTDPAAKTRIEGEALFIRAILHFDLVRLYALPYDATTQNTQLGVPLMLKAVTSTADVDKEKARNTVAEVYAQVEADLKAAIEKLPTDENGRANKFSAIGILSRVYLQEQKYAEARDAANRVITEGGYTLADDLETPFRTDNSSEGIFEIQQDVQNNAGTSNDGLATFYASLQGIGRADARVNTAFANSHELTDKRRTEMIYTGSGAKPGLFTQKWTDYYGNIPVVRLTEMYLTRAEANFRLGTTVGSAPLVDINTLRERAGLLPVAVLTVDQILAEREKELAFEGFRLHDYKRTKRSIGTLAYNSPKLLLPIPDREMNANKALVQNEGY